MELKKFADKIRYCTLKELEEQGFGHYGGSLSIVNMLAALYGHVMNVSAKKENDPKRDYLVLSKGHAGPALYATLYLKGYINEAFLMSLNKNGTRLPSHPDRLTVPGVDMTTGSLGQGIAAATGIAKGNLLRGYDNYTYCIVGDGELNEGLCWEAVQFAAHQKLDHFVVIVDNNGKQLDGPTDSICKTFDFSKKFSAFGFHTTHIENNDPDIIASALEDIKKITGAPHAVIIDTVKGDGVPIIETCEDNHHLRPSPEMAAEIRKSADELENKTGLKLEVHHG